jgi:hypothetical protein
MATLHWVPGMKVLGGDRITEDTLAIAPNCVPDYGDAATLGCLLKQIRESSLSLQEAESIAAGIYRYLIGVIDVADVVSDVLPILERAS